jgi:DNA polymerase-3 subunit alpha
MRRLSQAGLKVRYEEAEKRGEKVPESEYSRYDQRLDYELDVIDKMGFNGYFLIVQDFIGWAKQNDIPVGPGRGSGAGSLVAYSLRVTDLDPVPHSLIFERFLNPERISMPDFDIDFCQERRQDVIEYVTRKYGQNSVSQIITYGKLQARAAIRDVGRVLGMTYAEVDQISKLIPEKLGITLGEAIEMEPRLREQMELDPQIATLMDLAQRIEGLVRHAGIHAAGVIIADGNLVDHAPLYRGVEGENVVQYDMKHAEKIGLIKFDFLGLKTLTHIHEALKLIEINTGKKIRPSDIPLSDPGIYEIMTKGDTAGIFQFEGEGITAAIRDIRPNSFADITAINALYRPGPMDMIPEFAKRKHGESKVEYLFPELEEILKETYGIIVYQEQVQLIAAKIASYSLGEADLLRRAMGKKIAEEMAQQRQRFMEGAARNGFDKTKAEQLFDLMAEFANYGFNKSHAAAYCVIAAQTAWLKNYYPVEFYSALLSTEMNDTDKVVKYVKDAQRHHLLVRPPSVQHSTYKFSGRDQQIYFSMGAIKGVGEGAVQAILDARQTLADHRFTDLTQFFEAIDVRRVNKKALECLIKAGAFDDFQIHRAQMMANYSKFLERADVDRKNKEVGQASLFALDDSIVETVQLDPTAPWPRTACLAYEKEVLGFYLSDHPLKGLEGLFKVWTTNDIAGLAKVEPKKRVIVAGLISQFRELITKKGTRMAFGQLEDLSGNAELVIFPDVFAKTELVYKADRAVLIAGLLEREGDAVKIIVDSASLLDDVTKKSKQLVFRLEQGMQTKLDELKAIFEQYPGTTGVTFEIDIPEARSTVTLNLKEPQGVAPSNELFENIHSLFGRMDFFEVRG